MCARNLVAIAVPTIALSISSCAAPSALNDYAKSIERAINDAIAAGAADHAPFELDLAREKLKTSSARISGLARQ